jgi:hypothetical protein
MPVAMANPSRRADATSATSSMRLSARAEPPLPVAPRMPAGMIGMSRAASQAVQIALNSWRT